MECEVINSNGLLEHEAVLAMTRDELMQLRFAASMAHAHGFSQPILQTLLAVTDNI